MDPFGIVASIVTIVGGLVAGGTWLVRRLRKGQPAPGAVSSTPSPEQSAAERLRAATRLANDTSALLQEMRTLAGALHGGPPADFDERGARILRWVQSFERDHKPVLHQLGDIDGEENTRRVFSDLDLETPRVLNAHPPFVIGLGLGDPEPDWEELYRPMREALEREAVRVEAVLTWVTEVCVGAPTGKWTTKQLKAIRDEYFASRRAHCPLDGAILLMMPDMTTSAGRILKVVCQNCGRSAENV